MALENDVIVGKLKDEGINETLGTGLNFETEDELDSWVETFKTAIPEPSKKIEDYTREEIEEIASDPKFKGAKGLQSFVDSVRAGSRERKPTNRIETVEEEPEWAKKQRERQESIMARFASEDFDKTVNRLAEGLSPTQIARVKKGLRTDATEDQIKAEIDGYKLELSSDGIGNFPNPGGGGKGNVYDKSNSLSGRYAKKHKSKK